MNILIVNQPLNNRGDESAHKGLLRTLGNVGENINIEVLFVKANPDSVAQFSENHKQITYTNLTKVRAEKHISILMHTIGFYGISHLNPLLHGIIKRIKKADLVICAPGGICMGGFQDWAHLFYLSMARYYNKPIAYYGRSFGPFTEKTFLSKTFKKSSIKLLNYFSFLSIRDKKTEKLACEMGISYTRTVDSAFLDSPQAEIPESLKTTIGDDEYIVFVPNKLNWHYAYKNIQTERIIIFFTNLIQETQAKYPNCKILFLPQIFNSGVQNDIHFFRTIAQRISNEKIIVVEDIYSSDIQQAIIRSAKFLVGARYHSVVFAINNNTPFIALNYEHKISGLLETLEMSNRLVDITCAFDSENTTTDTIETYTQLLNKVESQKISNIKAKQIAHECFDEFQHSVLNIDTSNSQL